MSDVEGREDLIECGKANNWEVHRPANTHIADLHCRNVEFMHQTIDYIYIYTCT